MTAEQHSRIQTALGTDVARVAGQIDSILENGLTVPAYLLDELLAVLKNDSPELMATVAGRVFTYLIQEKINGNDGAVDPIGQPGLGFPKRRQL